MKKVLFLIIFYTVLIAPVYSQINPEWDVTLNSGISPIQAGTNQIITDAQGNSYITGYITEANLNTHTKVMKYNTTGILQWQVQYDTTYYFSSIDIDDVGNIYVAGGKNYLSLQTTKIFLLKFDSTGTLEWERFFGNILTSYSWDVAVDDSGNAIVGGISEDSSFVVLKYDGVGNLLWTQSEPNVQLGNAKTYLALDEIGDVYHVVRGWNTFNQELNATLIKYSSSGNKLWEVPYPGILPSGYTDAEDMVYKQGYVYLATSNDAFNVYQKAITVKYDTSGNIIWESMYDRTPYDELPVGLDVDDFGNVYVTGNLYPGSGCNDSLFTIGIDSAGSLIWERVIGTSYCLWDKSCDIEVDNQNFIYLIAQLAVSPSQFGFLTVKYDSSGNELWQTIYSNSTYQGTVPQSLSVDPAGNVYVSGVSKDWASIDFLTIKYGFTTGEEEISDKKNEIIIYPNPASDIISFNSNNSFDVEKILLYDLTGRLVFEKSVNIDSSVDISSLTPALYFYEIQSTKVESVYGKLLKQ